jgi:DNA-binding protein Fis
MKTSLREAINDAMVKYLKAVVADDGAEPLNVPDMAHEMAEGIIDIIMEQPESEQAALLAGTMSSLGDLYLQRRGLIDAPKKH